jgi:hypothetical protein
MGGVNCINIKIEHNANDDDLNVSLVAGIDNQLCKDLQKEVTAQIYKVRLRGNVIKY